MVLKCVKSLVTSINHCDFPIRLTVLDDDSDPSFLIQLKEVIGVADLINLDQSGFNHSWLRQLQTAAGSEDLVYVVEDDYLHEPNAITNMLNAYHYLNQRFGEQVVISPYDCPFRYESPKEYTTLLLYDGTRYWRHTRHTAGTIFSHSNLFRENWWAFEKLAREYPNITEDQSINLLYRTIERSDAPAIAFSPIPSVAYHLSYSEPPLIKTEHLGWRDLWK